jgi:hypothetical protein
MKRFDKEDEVAQGGKFFESKLDGYHTPVDGFSARSFMVLLPQ